MEEKLIISQDVRALITSIGAGRVQINVIQNVNTVRGGGSREVSTLSDLFDLISIVSGNRMHFLRDCLVDMVDKRFSSEDARANWIGIS